MSRSLAASEFGKKSLQRRLDGLIRHSNVAQDIVKKRDAELESLVKQKEKHGSEFFLSIGSCDTDADSASPSDSASPCTMDKESDTEWGQLRKCLQTMEHAVHRLSSDEIFPQTEDNRPEVFSEPQSMNRESSVGNQPPNGVQQLTCHSVLSSKVSGSRKRRVLPRNTGSSNLPGVKQHSQIEVSFSAVNVLSLSDFLHVIWPAERVLLAIQVAACTVPEYTIFLFL
jgi:hypothetical protein